MIFYHISATGLGPGGLGPGGLGFLGSSEIGIPNHQDPKHKLTTSLPPKNKIWLLINNPIYTLYSGYLLGIFPFKGLLGRSFTAFFVYHPKRVPPFSVWLCKRCDLLEVKRGRLWESYPKHLSFHKKYRVIPCHCIGWLIPIDYTIYTNPYNRIV